MALTAVQQVSAAVLNGEIWVAGGLTTSARSSAATQIYDPAKDAWRAGPSLPEGVDHAMLVTYRNQVMLIGGFRSRAGKSVGSAEVLRFDDSAGHWVPGVPLHYARAAGAAAVVGDKIVVVGGRVGPEELVAQTEVFDGVAWRDGASIPVPGDHLAAASDGSYLYAVGGRRIDSRHNTAAVQRYEPVTDRWTSLPPLAKPVSGAGAAIVNGQLLVAGGENSTPSAVSSVQAYDLIAPTPAWGLLPSLTLARHGLAVTAIGNTLYAIGGSTQPGHTASTATVDALNLPVRPTHPAEVWRSRHVALTAVQQVSAAVLNGEIWVAGGLTTSARSSAATQIYDPAKDAWRAGPSLPEGVDHAMLVTYRNQVMLIGGFRSRAGKSVGSAEVLRFDDSIGHWVPGVPLHYARAAGAAAVVGDKIVVVGGRVGPEELVAQTEVFDGVAWRDGASIPVPGDHLAAASDGSYLYAVGGRRIDSRHNTAAVQRYEPVTDRWTSLPPLAKPVSGAGAAIVNGQLLVAGGENSTPSAVSSVQAYDLIAPTPAWGLLPSLTLARHGLAVTAIGNTLYAIGGSTQPGHTASTATVDALTFS